MTAATQMPLAATPRLLTVKEFMELPEDGRYTELVRGRIVEAPPPQTDHGYCCVNISSILSNYVRSKDLGRVAGNDCGVVTERNPDSVRGADVAYYSYATVAKGPRPEGYWPTPELVFEVNSPSDRWPEVLAKMEEYLKAGVRVVCILDPASETLHVYRPVGSPSILTLDDELTLPDVLPEFRVSVRQLFE